MGQDIVETKSVNRIRVSSKYEKKENDENKRKILLDIAINAFDSFADLYVEIKELWEDYEYLTFNDENIIFYPELNLLLSTNDAFRFNVEKHDESYIWNQIKTMPSGNVCVELLTVVEARKIYFEYQKEFRPHNYTQIACRNSKKELGYITRDMNFVKINSESLGRVTATATVAAKGFLGALASVPDLYDSDVSNVVNVRVPLCFHLPKTITKLELLMDYELRPVEMKEIALMNNLTGMVKAGYVVLKDGVIQLTQAGKDAIVSGRLKKIGKVDLDSAVLQNYKSNEKVLDISKSDIKEKKLIFDYYLKCDFLRANMGEYDLKRLEDPNMGHWELWDGNELPNTKELSANSRVIARNPVADIQEDSIVGIDFGTKSTVVVYQNESGCIKPMPVGYGDIRKKLAVEDFENPTVIQFIDLNEFIKRYNEKAGRPYTLWKDLKVSHAANESMKDTGIRSDEFYSYMYDLKQWAGEGNQKIIIRDKSGRDTLLKTYGEIIQEEDGIDPIELYAYFIGLYVNNMNNGIFLDYLLSFPVTYEKDIRDAIIKSFKAGLKKSLPESMQNDSKVMQKFKVEAGASEPAAYAICALEKYGFEPEPGEKVFYGIFDFGGGTADFDFGLWTASENEDVYDYCIEHFASEGDRYLGGENLLQLLAFDVFKQNIDLCRKQRLTFSKPLELTDIPVEVKGYVNDSQEARMNLKLMMEKIRPFWEREGDKQGEEFDASDFSEFQIGLFDTEGVYKPNLAFETDVNSLEQIIRNRIEKGVRQFFNALKGTFSSKYLSKTLQVDHINIFMAGNSSKSPILKEIFEAKIKEWSCEIANGKAQNGSFFTLYPPLGSNAAKIIQQEKGLLNELDLEEPTGKTGVAWGLIEGRKGGRIEIKEEITADTEAKFAYYLGISVRKKFRVKIPREAEYGIWYKFIPALQEKFEITYTSLPEATNGALSEKDAGVLRKRLSLDKFGENLYIYIRLEGRESIAYAVGDANGVVDETTLQKASL